MCPVEQERYVPTLSLGCDEYAGVAESHWKEEALANLFVIKVEEYGLDKLLRSIFAGNKEIAELFTQITNGRTGEEQGTRTGNRGEMGVSPKILSDVPVGEESVSFRRRAGRDTERRGTEAGETGLEARIRWAKGLSSTPYR